jgi:hypothetical protein
VFPGLAVDCYGYSTPEPLRGFDRTAFTMRELRTPVPLLASARVGVRSAAVFGACREHGVAVEINCRPERQDPPDPLLRLAAGIGCLFAIDSDAHAPGQLDWLGSGCARAERFGIAPERVIRTAAGAARRQPGGSDSG